MKKYFDPELEVVNFEIADVTNFGEEDEISAGTLFPNLSIDW